jgi:hypothetical protein
VRLQLKNFFEYKLAEVLRIRIWDPGSGAFLAPGSGIRDPVLFWPPDPGSGIGKNPEPWSVIQDEQWTSRIIFVKTQFQFLGLKYLNSWMLIRIRDHVNPWSGKEKIGFGIRGGKNRILDGKKSDSGSWINIPDLQHRFADMFAKTSFYFAIRAKCSFFNMRFKAWMR